MAPKVSNHRARLAELRALRESGKKTFDNYKVEDVDELYEEVDEDGYKKIVRERLNQDDFVVDDNGEGYADDGREEWDRVPAHETDSGSDIDDRPPRGKQSKACKFADPLAHSSPDIQQRTMADTLPAAAKKQRDDEQAARRATDQTISRYLTNGAAAQPQNKTKIAKTKADDDFLGDLLDGLDTNIPAPASRPTKRERSRERLRTRDLSPVRDLKLPAAKKKKVFDDRMPSPSSPAAASADEDPFTLDQPGDVEDMPVAMTDAIVPSSPPIKIVAKRSSSGPNDDEDGEDENDMEIAHASAAKVTSENVASSRPLWKAIKSEASAAVSSLAAPSSPAKAVPNDEVDSSSWNRLTEQLNVVSGSQSEARGVGKLDSADALEEDGSLHMFWTDYTEVSGSLCLFGKVMNKKTKAYVSCFVKIDNIMRTLYFLPRQHRMRNGQETAEGVQMNDVYEEVDELMTRMKVDLFKIKASERKYAFELPNIPKAAKYLKLRYLYTKPSLEPDLTGETFSHTFGISTAMFEEFVLWKNIMGPCWLKIKIADFESLKNASHCRMDVLVSNPDSICAMPEVDEAPPLTLMSVALRTTFNAKENKQEILAISARIYENVSLSDTTPAEKLQCRSFTLIRPNGAAFPLGFEALAKKRNRGLIKTMKQELEILSFFLAQVDLADPDVILGHQLEGVDYSILLNRLHEKRIHQWSRIGRFRRTQWPSSIGRVGNNVFVERQMMAGRLLCDLSNDCGKSAMYKCQTWSLTEMCELYLPANSKRRDIDNEAALKTWATMKQGLMDYVTHMEADTHFITALTLRVQLLPLTKVLTNLAGNSWARTLTGTRAERNEYILLHEFHRNKYICPDKQTFKSNQQQQQQQQQQRGGGKDDENEDNAEGGKKKEKYRGGLVFEPEKGLYDKFVLVMDFNSLYPSIIQEFNICFTTVERAGLVSCAVQTIPCV